MAATTTPYKIVAASASFYTLMLFAAVKARNQQAELPTSIETISALHSLATSVGALAILRYADWQVQTSDDATKAQSTRSREFSVRPLLDDSANPTIAGTSTVANALTAFECGYLIYDTGALLYQAHLKSDRRSAAFAVSTLVKGSPIFLAHHLVLVSSLLYLQTYIAKGCEKGLWIIVSFLLMNASNPLLHLRWWLRRSSGRVSNQIDVALAVVFAATRFGVIAWVLQGYGSYHGMGPWQAYRRLRRECQAGTGILVGVNAVWWFALLAKITKRAVTSQKSG